MNISHTNQSNQIQGPEQETGRDRLRTWMENKGLNCLSKGLEEAEMDELKRSKRSS